MRDIQEAVLKFHIKHNLPIDERLEQSCSCGDVELSNAAMMLHVAASALLKAALANRCDGRLWRAQLVVEEAGELLEALRLKDEVAVADAVGDLDYVNVGTAVAYGLPFEAIQDEIHRSNMTKAPRNEDDPRMRNRDGEFRPPRLKEVIDEFHRT